MYRNINGNHTKLSTLNKVQISTIVAQCKIHMLLTVGEDEMVYLLAEDLPTYLSAVRCNPFSRSLAYWLDLVEHHSHEKHYHISPETLEWGGGLSGQIFYTKNDDKIPTFNY